MCCLYIFHYIFCQVTRPILFFHKVIKILFISAAITSILFAWLFWLTTISFCWARSIWQNLFWCPRTHVLWVFKLLILLLEKKITFIKLWNFTYLMIFRIPIKLSFRIQCSTRIVTCATIQCFLQNWIINHITTFTVVLTIYFLTI